MTKESTPLYSYYYSKTILYSDSQQFHYYQQNKQSPLIVP
jgi:hypothetical protein